MRILVHLWLHWGYVLDSADARSIELTLGPGAIPGSPASLAAHRGPIEFLRVSTGLRYVDTARLRASKRFSPYMNSHEGICAFAIALRAHIRLSRRSQH